ncbi:MAG: histidine kinase [Acidobacteriota bacterium]|nr:histidine kinase [Acidobacteriota bacterium]
MNPIASPERGWLVYAVLGATGSALGVIPLRQAGAAGSDAGWFAAWGIFLMFLAMQTWHLARYVPLAGTSFSRFLGTAIGSAVIVSGVWLMIGWNTARILVGLLPTVPEAFEAAWPMLWAWGGAAYLSVLFLIYAVTASDDGEASARRALESDVASRAAELRALRAQVNPHFLFNCLNSISSMTGRDPEGARRMCVELAEFFRSSLKAGAEQRVALPTELALLRRYLGIEQVRFGSRLDVQIVEHGELADVTVPPLLLQPLVENAVRHGIATLVQGGTVRVTASRDGERVELTVENAFDPDGRRPGTGVGLTNVRERLEAAYRGLATIRAETIPADDPIFKVSISLPAGS